MERSEIDSREGGGEDILEVIADLFAECRYLEGRRQYDMLSSADKARAGDKFRVSLERELEIRAVLADASLGGGEAAAATGGGGGSAGVADTKSTTTQMGGDWIWGSSFFGVETHYKIAPEGDLTVRMEGLMEDLPLFEQCAVIHEVDLFKTWIPFCCESKCVTKLGQAELIPYIGLWIPPLSRDALMHAYSANCLLEAGKILLIGKSIEDYEGTPWVSEGWFHSKMYIREFKAIIEARSPTTAKTIIIARIDPRAYLPQAIINIAVRNLAGVMLYYFQQEVQKVVQGDESNAHWQRIQANHAFYVGWLLPKLRMYCAFRGWEQPTVTSLGPLGQPPIEGEGSLPFFS